MMLSCNPVMVRFILWPDRSYQFDERKEVKI